MVAGWTPNVFATCFADVDRDVRVVARQRPVQLRQHGGAVLLVFHVEEIADDDAAQVAQVQLPGDGEVIDRKLVCFAASVAAQRK
jgi:hypothetical protein